MNTSSSFSSYPSHTYEMETRSNSKTFNLPEKCLENRIGCAWGRGNKFTIYPRSQKVDQTPITTENKLLHIRREVLLFHPILRKLVNESHGTYLAVQKAAETAKSTDNQLEFLKLSRQYRSVIRVCIESLQEASEKASDGFEKDNLLAYITIYYSIECIWHLCEILHVDNVPGDIVLPYLLEWVRFHFPCHEQTAAQLLEACEKGSEDHKDYWNTVIGMIVQGRVDVARALMKLHSESDTNEFKLVDNSLRSMPLYSVYGSISTGEFTVLWKHWQAECRAKLASRVLTAQPQLELIMKLTIGDYASFVSVRPQYSSWFDLLGGWVMYTAPWARRRELGSLAAACAGMMPAGTAPLDTTVRALLDGDLHQVIHEIQQMSDCNWFATHLTDVLYHCGNLKILDRHQENVTNRLRESLIFDYGCLLAEHKSLWTVGVAYLAGCGNPGRRRAELMLERVPLQSEAKAMRVLAEAKKHGLSDVVQSVCRCMSARAVRAARGGSAGGALAWGVRARCGASAGRAAHGLLRQYVRTRTLPAADLLRTLPPQALMHDALLFLVKYNDFHILYSSREFQKAAELLVSLITSKIAPDYFWDTLLLDALPLLESDPVVLGANETCALMQALELHTHSSTQRANSSPQPSESSALVKSSLPADSVSLLRLALARNLARAALAQISPNPETIRTA